MEERAREVRGEGGDSQQGWRSMTKEDTMMTMIG
jgi:hypothetical protein